MQEYKENKSNRICKDCKHYRNISNKHLCFSPSNGIDIVTGELIILDCRKSRENICGINGKFFQKDDSMQDMLNKLMTSRRIKYGM